MAAGNSPAGLAVHGVSNDGLTIDSSATSCILAATLCSRARIWPMIFRRLRRSVDSDGNGENGAGAAQIFLRSRASRCGHIRDLRSTIWGRSFRFPEKRQGLAPAVPGTVEQPLNYGYKRNKYTWREKRLSGAGFQGARRRARERRDDGDFSRGKRVTASGGKRTLWRDDRNMSLISTCLAQRPQTCLYHAEAHTMILRQFAWPTVRGDGHSR